MSRILAAMSGGVDSSVAAALLKDAGHEVIGVFMRSGVSGDTVGEKQGCCSVEDAMDARRVADPLCWTIRCTTPRESGPAMVSSCTR